jgi:RNA polymerase sigma-70 factor (ECF subfamily)
MDSDENLARRAMGDETAFVTLYRRHVGRVHSYASWKVGTEDAEDVTAEVFMRAIEGIAGFRGDASFKTWLFGIARRIIAQHFRAQNKMSFDEVLDIPDELDIEEIHLSNERAELVQSLVSRLREPYRDAIELRYWAGMDTREIAVVLGKKVGAIRVTLHRAIRELSAMWKEE